MKLVLNAKCGTCGVALPSEATLEVGGRIECPQCNKVAVQSVEQPMQTPVVVSKKPRGW